MKMAAPLSNSSSIITPQQHGIASQHLPPQHGTGAQGSGRPASVFLEEGKVRELALHIHSCLVQAQQLKIATNPQQQQPATSQQMISQAEAMTKRLTEAVLTLQEAVKGSTLLEIQERLNAMATKLDLKFDVQRSKQSELTSIFLVCDAYYVEVCCQDNGYVTSVKLAQANNQSDSEVLTQLARASKFDEFESHLRSLQEFYAMSSSSGEANNMYRVLSSLESVLLSITKVSPQAPLRDVIMNNPLGHVIPHSGGLPMKLTFFVHPCEVQKSPSLFSAYPSDAEHNRQVEGPEVGVSSKLLLESSSKMYLLSIDPALFDVSKATFFPITGQKGVNISVNYVLHISKEIPVCESIRKSLHDVVYAAEPHYQSLRGPHINQLIAKETATARGVEVCTTKSRVVRLPSQCHHYYMPEELQSSDLSHDQGHMPMECGSLLSKVSFLHPVHIFSIVTLLRQQLVYNSLVASLLGRSPKDVFSLPSELDIVFEVMTQPAEKITVVVDMQSDVRPTLAIEFFIPDQQPTSPLVKVKVGHDGLPTESPQLSAIVKRCLSIPVTLYAVVKCPQLLEGGGAKLFRDYLQTLHDFNSELRGGATVTTS